MMKLLLVAALTVACVNAVMIPEKGICKFYDKTVKAIKCWDSANDVINPPTLQHTADTPFTWGDYYTGKETATGASIDVFVRRGPGQTETPNLKVAAVCEFNNDYKKNSDGNYAFCTGGNYCQTFRSCDNPQITYCFRFKQKGSKFDIIPAKCPGA